MSLPRRRALLLLGGGTWLAGAAPEPLTVFAAASLTDALRAVDGVWQAQGGGALRLVFGASSTLARQIQAGAPADLFVSADERWMDELASHDLLVPGTRADLLHNRLVLIVPAEGSGRGPPAMMTPDFDLAGLLGRDGRLAVGDPGHVPAGLYARQALTRLGLWPAMAPRLAPATDVRAALQLVARGEAPAGIVYATDAAAAPAVRVVALFPPALHDPITYPVAIPRGHDGAGARALLAFLAGSAARAIFVRLGFSPE